MKRIILIVLFFTFFPSFLGGVFSAGASGGGKDRKSCVIEENDDFLICEDADGRKVKLTKNPERVVIGFTSYVSLWYYAGGRAVGIPDGRSTANIPEEAKNVDKIGGFSSLNMEKIITLKPDLALLNGNVREHRSAQDMLRDNGTESIIMEYNNYSDFLRILDLFTRLNDRKDGTKKLALPVVTEIDAVIEKASKLKGPRFISFLQTGRGLSAETNRANTAQMAMLLGGRNIVSEAGVPENITRVKFSMERVMMEEPDIILVTTMGDSKKLAKKLREKFMKDPVWASLKAVKAGRVYFLPNRYFLYKANENYPTSFRILAKAMYPGESWN